jgi:uncharacterized protein
MRAKPLTRALPVILTIIPLCLGGCLGRSPSPRFYSLTPIQETQGISRQSPAANAVIGIGPIRLADYLDNSKIITRTSDNQLIKGEYDRWAGSFKNNFTNVLAENLGDLLRTDRIFLYPWRTSAPLDYQVTMDVIRLDGKLGEAAWLVARWSVFEGPDKKLLTMNRSSIREPVSGPGYTALVAAQSRAIAQLSQEIALAIQKAGR